MWIDRLTSRPSHPSDSELVDCVLSARGADSSPDSARQEHVATCTTCAQRYAELVHTLDDLSEAAAAEADAVFTPDALGRQHREIVRRLENQGRTADVFVFPSRHAPLAGQRPAVASSARWVTAAAVVGLAAGLALGLTFDRFGGPTPGASTAGPVEIGVEFRLSSGDDALLDAVDGLLARPRLPELQLYDELTPERVSFVYRAR